MIYCQKARDMDIVIHNRCETCIGEFESVFVRHHAGFIRLFRRKWPLGNCDRTFIPALSFIDCKFKGS